MDIIINTAKVDRVLRNTEVATSNVGLSIFLGSHPKQVIQARTERRFHSEGDAATGSWEQLKDTTVSIRESLGYPGAHPINIRTGSLKDFVTNAPGRITPTGVGAQLEYPGDQPAGTVSMAYHTAQLGNSAKNTPARPAVAVDTLDLGLILAELRLYIQAGW